ncbi:MAG: ribonuclease E/G, partial [Acidaminococcaceae bacterium]
DYLTTQVEQIILDDPAVHKRVCELLQAIGGQHLEKICLYAGKDDIFTNYQLDEQIAGISDRKVWLSCGGYLVIDYTEAMTVIDVNSGKFSG